VKAFLRAVALWSLLAAIAWLLVQPSSPKVDEVIAGCLTLVLPALAVWLTGRALAGLPPGRTWRWTFWAVTLAGWAMVLLCAAGRYEGAVTADQRTVLLQAAFCAFVLPACIAMRSRIFPTWSGLRDAAAGLAILALAGVAAVWGYDAQTRAIASRAEARWTQIGLPMAEFEKTLVPVAENSGSQVVRQALRELVSTRFYKEGTAAAEREPAIESLEATTDLVEKAVLLLSPKSPPGDALKLSELSVAAMEPHAQALETAYQRILTSEPAVWAYDPADGWKVSVPNFLGLRKFSQLTAAESLRLLAAGDERGAARAITAGLRVQEGLNQSPTLVALMIHVAVEALMAQQQARLPVEGDGLAAVARDAAILNASLVRSMQWEAWMCLRRADQVVSEDILGDHGLHSLPEWARRIVDRHYLPRQCVLSALNSAEHVAIRKSPGTRGLADYGSSLHETVSLKNPSMCDMNISRAAMRICATLLLREQAELIRISRARLAAGRNVEPYDSAALPGVRWELNADPVKHTVSIRLANAPQWIVEQVVAPPEFWVLPIDGSVAWQFRTPSRTVAANRAR
jgi:hypothetical protein